MGRSYWLLQRFNKQLYTMGQMVKMILVIPDYGSCSLFVVLQDQFDFLENSLFSPQGRCMETTT
jgi:hypothetical protein